MRGLETVRLGEAWVYNGFWDREHKELGGGAGLTGKQRKWNLFP